jgi:hypothetical protein
MSTKKEDLSCFQSGRLLKNIVKLTLGALFIFPSIVSARDGLDARQTSALKDAFTYVIESAPELSEEDRHILHSLEAEIVRTYPQLSFQGQKWQLPPLPPTDLSGPGQLRKDLQLAWIWFVIGIALTVLVTDQQAIAPVVPPPPVHPICQRFENSFERGLQNILDIGASQKQICAFLQSFRDLPEYCDLLRNRIEAVRQKYQCE